MDIVAVFPEPDAGNIIPKPGGSWPGELPELFDWVRRAKEEASNKENPLRRCSRCIPAHTPDFKAPVLLGANGVDGLRRDGFSPLETGNRLIAIFSTWTAAKPWRNLKNVREEWLRSLEGAPIEVWLPSTESTEQHWAIVQGDQPKRLAWDRLGVIGRKALCDWISVARHLQGSVTQPYVRPWVISSRYAAILVERPMLNPVQAV